MINATYRVGNHNARNIYRYSYRADEDVHVGVMFTPEDGRLAVDALNLAHNANNALKKPALIRQYLVRAFTADMSGCLTAADTEQPCRTFYLFASTEEEAARMFHVRHPAAVIRDLWQLMPPGYLGSNVFTPDRDDRDLGEAVDKLKAAARNKNEVPW